MGITILVLSAIVAVSSCIIEIAKWRKKNWPERMHFILVIITSVIVCIYQIGVTTQAAREKQIEAKAGTVSGSETTSKATGFIIRGSNDIGIFMKGQDFGISTGDQESLMTYKIQNKKLYSTFIVRDENMNVIADMHDNIWKIYSPEKYDYNNDNSALEVVTAGDHRVVFQIELKNGNIYFAGLVMTKSGRGLYVFPEISTGRGKLTTFTQPQDNFKLPDSIKPMFKYPRELNWGVRMN